MSSTKLFAVAALGVLALAGCGGSGDDGTSTDDLGKTKYHYEPVIEGVTFNPGCGISNPQDTSDECNYGFSVRLQKEYADLTVTNTHSTSNSNKTVTITIDTWSYSQIHPMIVEGPMNDDLGLLGADVGETYTVKVEDRNSKVLWSGKVATLFHL